MDPPRLRLCRDCLSRDSGGAARCPHCGSPRTIDLDAAAGLAIAHVDCDAFYAAVEKRDDPSLNDKPLIVGGEGEQKLLVADKIVEHRVEESRVRRGGAKVVGAEAGQVEEPAQPVGIGGDECQSAYRQRPSGLEGCRLPRFQGIVHSPIRLS